VVSADHYSEHNNAAHSFANDFIAGDILGIPGFIYLVTMMMLIICCISVIIIYRQQKSHRRRRSDSIKLSTSDRDSNSNGSGSTRLPQIEMKAISIGGIHSHSVMMQTPNSMVSAVSFIIETPDNSSPLMLEANPLHQLNQLNLNETMASSVISIPPLPMDTQSLPTSPVSKDGDHHNILMYYSIRR